MKKILRVLMIIIFIPIVIYAIIFFNTNSIVRDFKDNVNRKINRNINYGELGRFYRTDETTYDHATCSIHRLLVVHNFKKGYVYVLYSYAGYDKNSKLIYASWDILSKWYIEKVNGRWKVVRIEEDP